MLTIDQIKTVITDSKEISVEKEVERMRYLEWLKRGAGSRLIKVISGFRRSGKTFLLKQLSKNIEKSGGVPFWNICFLNFEHDLLSKIKDVEDLRNLFDLYIKNIAVPNKPVYLVFDEIQNIKDWEKLVRTLYEKGGYNIFISGSNSQLLSGELSSSLSGRFIELKIYPFDFKEYLQFNNIQVNRDDNYYRQKDLIDNLYQKYLLYGGLPEQFNLEEEFKNNYLEALIQKIILDDIVKRFQIRKAFLLSELFQFVIGNMTSHLSLRKICNAFKSQGIDISVPTLNRYLAYFQSAYVFFKLSRFSYKLYTLFEKNNKYYAVDNLLLNFDFISREKKLENVIAGFLIKKYGLQNVFFGMEDKGYEVDFIVKQKVGRFLIIQVCLYLTDENKKREIGNLQVANKYLKGDRLVVVEADLRKEKKEKVKVKTVVEYLLEI